MINYPLYLVPFDFSTISENALEISIQLAKKNKGSVYLLNVASNKSDKPILRQKFINVLKNMSKEDRLLITANVIVGSVFEDIGKAANILRPSLVIMGTHGAKGIQKLFGSHVEKIIINTDSPLLITQGIKPINDVKNIIMPFSFEQKSLQITKFASKMAKKFNARIHLVGHHDNVNAHENKIQTNKNIVKNYMLDNSVSYKIVNLPNIKHFENEMMKYAAEVDADIIASAYSNDKFFQTTNSYMRTMFENDLNIPVLTVNAEEVSQYHY